MRCLRPTHRILRGEPCLVDRVDSPAICERSPDFGLAHAAGTDEAGLPVAEAEEEVPGTWTKHGTQAAFERHALHIGENVEQAAVKRSVEGLPEVGQRERIGDEEGGREPPGGGLLLGTGDGGGRGIYPGDLDAPRGQVQRVLARPAAQVDHGAREGARFRKPLDDRLRPADVPGRRAVPVRPVEAHRHTIPADPFGRFGSHVHRRCAPSLFACLFRRADQIVGASAVGRISHRDR